MKIELHEILECCKGGFKHNKIVVRKEEHKMEKDSLKVEFAVEKGTILTSIELENRDLKKGGCISKNELWLMQDGSLRVYTSHDTWSNNIALNKPTLLTRYRAVNQDIEQFKIEDIIKGLEEAMDRKTKNLESRLRQQQNKVKEFKKLLNK